MPPPAATAAKRSARPTSLAYGNTAPPVNTRPLPSGNATSWPGAMQPTSPAICRDSSSTTAVEHDVVS
jgi:hypothetical protein